MGGRVAGEGGSLRRAEGLGPERHLRVQAMFAFGELGRVERSAPELAAFGRDRLEGRVAFLATVRADGSPRVHPVEAWFAAGRMLVRMWPTSPKVRDLKHAPRYALHSLMDNFEGVGGEFFVAGRAARVDDQALIATASVGKHDPEQYVLFEFGVDEAIGTIYEGEEPVRHRMRAS
jgi:hypothetical protein